MGNHVKIVGCCATVSNAIDTKTEGDVTSQITSLNKLVRHLRNKDNVTSIVTQLVSPGFAVDSRFPIAFI